MKILFLTLLKTNNIDDRGIYSDLLREFYNQGHEIFVVAPIERRFKSKTTITKYNNATILNVRTLNIQKTNLIEKGIGTLLLESQYLSAIKKYYSKEKFDLILYSTPPIMYSRIIKYIKKRDNAFAYLLLKDIFPQNAVDMGMLNKNLFLYKYFRYKEIELYKISDKIGCMSAANVKYVVEQNHFLSQNKIEICPNSIEPLDSKTIDTYKIKIRDTYNIQEDKIVFIFGGNLGKPQGINFILKILETFLFNEAVFFLIVGDGTEFKTIAKWFNDSKPQNAKLIKYLERKEFDLLLSSCDVGMIFLDKRFTIPNFPSKALSYMEFSLPIIAATDISTDFKDIIEQNGFGLSSLNGDIKTFQQHVNYFINNKENLKEMGKKARKYLENNYTVKISNKIILNSYSVSKG